jgi:hypothetical protein
VYHRVEAEEGGFSFLLQGQVMAYDADFQDMFGCSVAVAGDLYVVGACLDNDLGSDSGRMMSDGS